MQQDNDSKHKSKSITEWQQKKKQVFCCGQVSVLTSSWLRCFGKRTIHTRNHKNIAELKGFFFKEEWSCILPDRCAGLIHNCRKFLGEVLAAKGGSTSHEITHSHSSSTVNVCMVCLVQTSNSIIVWVLGLFWRVNKMLWPIYVEININ